ncbi:MAG: multidrug effflux MFS transporter [Aquimonas sp.]|nr:multidrug effflux MFS transporter [Aquimonas sp.]
MAIDHAPASSPLQRPQVPPLRLALVLGGLAMFGPFAIDSIFPAFGVIQAEFGIGAAAMQQSVSVYLLAYALASLVHGPLSDAYGRRPVILAGVALFLVASVGCALASSLGELLFWRAVQGMSSGVGIIIGRAIVRDLREGEAAQRLMSQISMIFTIAPAIAPIVGGWLLGWSNWQMIFWFLVGFAAVLWVLTALTLPETHPAPLRLPLSLRGLMRTNAHMLRNRSFVLLSLVGTFNFGALFIYIASAPVFVLQHLGLNEQQFGWFFAPTVAGMAFGAFLSGRSAGRISPRASAGLGFVVCVIATSGGALYAALADQVVFPWAVLPIALNAVGVALVFPIITLALLDLYPRHRGAASSMQSFISLLISAGVAGLLSPLVSASASALAWTALAGSLLAAGLWLLQQRMSQQTLQVPLPGTAAGLEPTDRL